MPYHEIVNCLKAVVAGQDYVSPALSSTIRRSAGAAADGEKPALAELTPSESRILN
jgi:DNA-binding NarL/FixJ family response regulator